MLGPGRWIVIACLAASGCGRTPLADAAASGQDATSGAGATGGAVTSGVGGGAGGHGAAGGGPGGGPSSPCGTLVDAGDFAVFSGSNDHQHARPYLVELDDPSRVGIAFALVPIELPAPAEVPIGQNAFEPWGSWPPPDVLEPQRGANQGGQTFIAGTAGTSFALFLDTAARLRPLAPHMLFSTAVIPGSTTGGLPDGVLLDTALPASPAFVARTAAGHLTGHAMENGPYSYLRVDAIATGPTVTTTYGGLACGSSPVVAGAFASAPGVFVAASSGKPYGSCGDDNGVPGPPNELQVSVVLGNDFQEGALITGSDPIHRLFVAPRPIGGAWIVWQEDGSSALVMPPVMAVRVDVLGHQEGPPIEVSPTGASNGVFAVSAFGEGIVVAWIDSIDPSAPTIVVQTLLDDGSFGAGTSFSSSAGWFVGDQLTVLGSPAGDAILLAWPGFSNGGDDAPPRTRIARLDCVSDFD